MSTAALDAPPLVPEPWSGTVGRAPRRERACDGRWPRALLLFLVYLALSFANDPRGTLGTDTGGKLATLHAMEHTGALDPDIGYWAERPRPGRHAASALLHEPGRRQLGQRHHACRWCTRRWPLYQVGGDRGLLLLPMLGAVLCALAAALASGDCWAPATGGRSFWVVGLATPVAIYALDFWEHTLGLALHAVRRRRVASRSRDEQAGARAAFGRRCCSSASARRCAPRRSCTSRWRRRSPSPRDCSGATPWVASSASVP